MELVDTTHSPAQGGQASKKPRLVFTDLQRRTLQAIFKVQIVHSLLISQTFFFVILKKNLNMKFKNVKNHKVSKPIHK